LLVNDLLDREREEGYQPTVQRRYCDNILTGALHKKHKHDKNINLALEIGGNKDMVKLI
jgi:hypothetical protein